MTQTLVNLETDVSRGVLLCSYHHHLIHQGNWTFDMNDGVPWFVPPTYIDIDPRKRRNHFFRRPRQNAIDRHEGISSATGPPVHVPNAGKSAPLRAFSPAWNEQDLSDELADSAAPVPDLPASPKQHEGSERPPEDEFVLPSAAWTDWTDSPGTADRAQDYVARSEPRWVEADGDTEQPTHEELYARDPNSPGSWHTGWSSPDGGLPTWG